ncbi:MAG TPA: biopolymer transporter ExbD [Chthoniobacterales bacterium]
MRRFSDRNKISTLNEINITPLLDLCFVLLVIFMITTPLLENSINLVVPTSQTATDAVEPSKVQVISIDKEEHLELNNDAVDLEDLEAELRDLLKKDPNLAVVVRPHKELPVQKFVNVMDVLQKVKISKVGVLTRPED